MGNLHSTSSTSIGGNLAPPQQKKRFLITPKKLRAKLRRQSVELNSGIGDSAHNPKKRGENDDQTADRGETNAMCSSSPLYLHTFIYTLIYRTIDQNKITRQ